MQQSLLHASVAFVSASASAYEAEAEAWFTLSQVSQRYSIYIKKFPLKFLCQLQKNQT